ncbi:MAG: thioredoxin family protein [Sedimentisphaerales bacterium]|jgi:thioredoxin 1
MNKAAKLIIVIVLIAAIAGVAMVKKTQKGTGAIVVEEVNKPYATIQGNLPRLLDLGADKCIPCKMMAPILEELKTTYNGKLQVDFIDVWKNPGEANKYKISVIPTQIFYDSSGKELFRHEGFFPKEGIIAKWKEFGVDLGGPK